MAIRPRSACRARIIIAYSLSFAVHRVAQAAEPFADRPTSIAVVRTNAAADCPSADDLAMMVNGIAPGASLVAARSDETPGIVITLDRDEVDFRARIESFAPVTGVRIISDPGASCAGLGRALAVTLALLVDKTRSAADPPIAPGSTAPAASAAGSAPRGPAPGPKAAVAGRVGLGVALGVTFDVAPAAWFGATVASGVFSAELDALHIPRERRTVDSIALHLDLWGGRAKACGQLWRARQSWPSGAACVEAVAGALNARAENVDNPTPVTSTWFGAGAGLEFGGRLLGPLAWHAEGAAFGPIADERFRVRGREGLVHRPPRIAALAGLSLGVSFW